MKLDKFLKELVEEMPKYEIPQYNEEDILDAFQSEKPEVELKAVFGEDFWPKVQRWLKVELKDIKVSKEEINVPGGEIKAKLERYFETDTPRQEENVKALTRALLNAFEAWDKKEIKDFDLPHTKI